MPARSGSSCRPRPPRARPRARSAGRSSRPRRAGARTSSVSPAARRSSSSFVRTHVIGQRSELTSREWATSATVAARMARPSYLILHGYAGSGPGHWQSWLAGRLRSGDASVHFPDLPGRRTSPRLLGVAGRARARDGPVHRAARRHLPQRRVPAVAAPRGARRQARRARAAGRAAVGVGRARTSLAHFFPAPAVELDNARLVVLRQRPVLPRGRGERLPRPADRPAARRRATSTRRPATARGPRSRRGRARARRRSDRDKRESEPQGEFSQRREPAGRASPVTAREP